MSFRMCVDRFSVTAVTFLLLFPGFYSTMAVTTLQSFRGCAVREFTFAAKKPGCRSLRISTEACWGRCHTWEVIETCYNILELLKRNQYTRACGVYVCVVTCVLVCFGISEASPGAAVYPEAPQCLHLQPYTPPDCTFTWLWPWHLPRLSLPSGLTVWLHLLLLKPHRVW